MEKKTLQTKTTREFFDYLLKANRKDKIPIGYFKVSSKKKDKKPIQLKLPL